MRKIFLALFLFSAVQLAAQQTDPTAVYRLRRDSLFRLQNRAGEAYSANKAKNDTLADRWFAESNRLFAEINEMTLQFIEQHAGTQAAATVLRENLFMLIDLDALKRAVTIVDQHPDQFDASTVAELRRMLDEKSARSMLTKRAPESTWEDRNGKPVALSRFKGGYVWLNFWTSW